MRLIVSEKNIAARRIAEILAVGKPKTDKVYATPVYTFRRDGEDWVSIGLKGHVLAVDFPHALSYVMVRGVAQWADGRVTPAQLPPALPAPPWPVRSRPYTRRGSTSRHGSCSLCVTLCGRQWASTSPRRTSCVH